jgi:hypothetical protein
MIDAGTLRDLLDYDPDSGVFTWRTRGRAHFGRDNQWRNWNGRYPGLVAGTVGPRGYRAIAVLGHLYPAHRLAWLYVHGQWPEGQIDHVNGGRDDNRIGNLRDVSSAENAKNRRLTRKSATGRIGVNEYAYGRRKQYVARIRVDGRLHHLGYFDTVEQASAARSEAEARFGFHRNHGSRTPLKSRGFENTRRG